jgi:heme-degrading monooxygenase HmoA
MFARVTTLYIRKDLIDKAIELAKESIVPAAKQQEGFISFTTLVDRECGKGYVITLWESKENIEANEESQYYQQQLMKLMVTFTADPMKETFEVAIRA